MSAGVAYTTMAAPVYETVAAPVTYAAAPTVTTMAAPVAYETIAAPATYATYAAPTTTMAAPAYVGTTTMAAPVTTTVAPVAYETVAAPAAYTTYAAPTTMTMAAPVTYAASSMRAPVTYAPQSPAPVTRLASSMRAPVTYAMPNRMVSNGVAMPEIVQSLCLVVGPEPADLTAGIPNSQQIATQKAAYIAALDKQLSDGIATIEKERSIEQKMVEFTTDKQLDLLKEQLFERKTEQIALLDEQATIAVLELKKACVERKIQLDAQASGLNMDYQMKYVQTELARKTYAFQKTYASAENKLLEQYNAQVAQANVRF